MRRKMFCNCALVLATVALSTTSLQSQSPDAKDSFWQTVDKVPSEKLPPASKIRAFRVFNLNHGRARESLHGIASEGSPKSLTRNPQNIISLPMPDGSLAKFQILESPIMERELAAKFPEIKTYVGRGVDDPAASVRLDYAPRGFHAQVLSARGTIYIDPLTQTETNLYSCYYRRDVSPDGQDFQCLTDTATVDAQPEIAARNGAEFRIGDSLRTYRIAIAAQGEYTAFQGGSVSSGLAAIVTALNRVNGIYESELAVRFILVEHNDRLIFTNPNTDPYSANSASSTAMTENQKTIDRIIGSANYDLGIVLNTGNGGVAQVHTVCQDGWKAMACVGSPNPTGDGFYVDYLTHEIGHQFGALHTFNSVSSGNCSTYTRTSGSAYEPGSGSTVMAYAGICGGDNLQQFTDPYFHATSLNEIGTYITLGNGNSCPAQSATGNNPPYVSAGSSYTIPAQTPFRLVASGGDPDGDPITYCWEEMDLGPPQSLTDADNGSSPLFRSFNPTTDSFRIFPQMTDILHGSFSRGEKLPTMDRTMNFRVTVRDNRGGTSSSDTQVFVHSTGAAFQITSPSSRVTWYGLTSQTINWDVAGTTDAPINAGAVSILLALDGTNFSTTLSGWVPNNGSAQVTLPNVAVDGARIAVQPVGNIFFAVSPADVSLRESVPPQITSQPQGTRVQPRANVTFHVGVDATPPISYQWQSDDNDIPGATNSSLTVDVTSAEQSGFYRCVVSNPAGTITSDEAELVVVAERVLPTVSIIEPRANSRQSNDTVVVTGKASDNAVVRRIRYQFNGEEPQTIGGANEWSVDVHPVPGTNLFSIVSIDSSGNESHPATRQFFYVVTSMLTLWTNGVGKVSPNLDGQRLEIGRAYAVKASPARGQIFTGWSGGVDDTNATLKFIMQPDLQLQANFIPNPFIPVRGVYRGLLFQPDSIQPESSGTVTVTTTDRGTFSSKVLVGGAGYSFSGSVDLNGDGSRTIHRSKKSPLTLNLHLDLSDGSDQITGDVTDGTWDSTFHADHNRFHSRTNPAPQAGRYTMVFPGSYDANASPGGDGYALVNISKSGAIALAGKLADGTGISQAAWLSKNGDWPFYADLYGHKGTILSWINLRNDDSSEFDSSAVWIKPARPRDKLYPAGFTQGLTLTGSRYVAPKNPSPVLNFAEGFVTLSSADLPEGQISDVVLSNNVFHVVQGTNRLSLSLNLASGKISGTFIHPVTRAKTGFSGVILQQQNEGQGFFSTPHQSGRVALRPE